MEPQALTRNKKPRRPAFQNVLKVLPEKPDQLAHPDRLVILDRTAPMRLLETPAHLARPVPPDLPESLALLARLAKPEHLVNYLP